MVATSAAAMALSLAVSASAAAPASSPAPTGSTAASARPAAPDASLQKATPEQRAAAERYPPVARAAFWAHEADLDPADVTAGVKLATALRQLGRLEEADAAASRVLMVDPTNLEALIEVSRARISARQGFFAIQPLKLAMTRAPKDWRAPSLLGVALEQSERLDEAREAYRQALALSPDNPAVLSNLGLSFASHGEPAQAEPLLRRAVLQPGATAQERQNLAVFLGTQGRMDEAEKLIREDLPPDLAAANLAYLRSLQTKP